MTIKVLQRLVSQVDSCIGNITTEFNALFTSSLFDSVIYGRGSGKVMFGLDCARCPLSFLHY